MIEQKPSPRIDRRLLLALAGLGGVVLGLLLLVTVFGGNDKQAGGAPPRPAGTAVPGVSTPEAPPGAEPTPLVAAPRDPFVQIVTVPAEPSSGQPAPAQGAPPAGGAPAEGAAEAPAVSAQPTPTANDATAASTPNPPTEDAGQASLQLRSIFRDGAGVDRATIVVDGQPFSPARGEVFSHGFRLERIDGRCVEVSAGAARAQMCLPAAVP